MNIQEHLYVVEKIVGRKKMPSGSFMYRVKWKGYPSYQNTWEPLEHLGSVHSLVNRYDENYSKLQSQRRKARNRSQLAKRKKNIEDISKISSPIVPKFSHSSDQVFKKQKRKRIQQKDRTGRTGTSQISSLHQVDDQGCSKSKKEELTQSQKFGASFQEHSQVVEDYPKSKKRSRANYQGGSHKKRAMPKDRNPDVQKKKRIKKEQKNELPKPSNYSKEKRIMKRRGCTFNNRNHQQGQYSKKLKRKQRFTSKRSCHRIGSQKIWQKESGVEEGLQVTSLLKKNKKWAKILQTLQQKQQTQIRLVDTKSNPKKEEPQFSLLPFSITLNQDEPSSFFSEASPGSRNNIWETRPSKKLQVSVKRGNSSERVSKNFINSKLPCLKLLRERKREAQLRERMRPEWEDSPDTQKTSLKGQLKKFGNENSVSVRFDKEANLHLVLMNENDEECEFHAKDLSLLCAKWAKQFYQQFV